MLGKTCMELDLIMIGVQIIILIEEERFLVIWEMEQDKEEMLMIDHSINKYKTIKNNHFLIK